MDIESQRQSHDAFSTVEDDLNAALDESLGPRGPDCLYDIVGALGLAAGATAVDVGCGEGDHAIALARRFGLCVTGIDPSQRQLAVATEGLRAAAAAEPSLLARVSFRAGTAEALPVPDAGADLVWCRDVLSLVANLGAAYAEMRRALRPGGRAVLYQMVTTDRLEPREAAWFLPVMGCVADSMRVECIEAAVARAGLRIDRVDDLSSEWGEHAEEHSGKGARMLRHAARLLREPERYRAQFGAANCDIALGDSLWHVYRMIGKLAGRVYVLSVA